MLLIYAADQSYEMVGCHPESFPWAKPPHMGLIAAAGKPTAPRRIFP